MSECCKVGYSATLARAHVHNFICSENRGFPFAGGPMQRGHLNGSEVMPGFCEVGHSTMLARAQGHNFKPQWNRRLKIEEGTTCW